jgi:ABC-type uncharacterized transport system auxiliary subunit
MKLKRLLALTGTCALLLGACTKEITQQHVYDNTIYLLDTVPVYTSSVEKTKKKTPEQFLTILYADLYNQAISSNEMAEMSQLLLSIGDKLMVRELLLSSFMNAGGVNLPTDSEMRADVDAFVEDTYIRFFVRLPTEYERYYLRERIENDLDLSPELIFTSFALSTEYQYY